MKPFIILLVQLLLVVSPLASMGWNEPPGASVLLRDVNALTLYKDRFTTGRRSSPVPQLKCVGGSAGCGAFVPQVVQCINKGWDGVDVQWQCKADMDNSYRFGQIEVNCEGYSHPNDAYILTGSCALEYKLELTKEGYRRRAQGAGGGSYSFFGNKHHQQRHHQSSSLECLLGVAVLLLLAYAIYQIFLIGEPTRPSPHYPGANPGYGVNPGYGFHSDHYSNQQHYPGGGCAPTGTGGGGFWTGLGTGGILGYLFGSHRRQPYGYSRFTDSRPEPEAAREPTNSTGTRTASGFGRTTRR